MLHRAEFHPELSPGHASRIEPLPVVLAVMVFAVLSLMTGFSSPAFLEADACLHFLYARFALAEPYRLADVWGRPVCTAIYALPAALLGRAGTRVTSLLLALAVAWVAARIARRQGLRWPALALIFTLAQPPVFTHSFSELTELPFALLVGCAFLAYQARLMGTMAVLVALTPLSRPEGFGLLPVAAVALLLHRKAWQVLLLPLGVVAWSVAGWYLFGMAGSWWRWLPDHWPYAAASTYAPGPLLHFVAALPAVVAPLVFPATLLGAWCSAALGPWRDALRRFFDDHTARCAFLVAAIPLSVLVIHSLLYWRGLMASNGELRYMLTVAPFWGVLSARGWETAFTWLRARRIYARHVYAWAGAAAVLTVGANGFYKVFPLKLDENWQTARTAVTWLGDHPDPGRPYLMTSHPAFCYFLDVSPTDRTRMKDLNAGTVTAPPPGTRLVWDSLYGTTNADRGRVVDERSIVAGGWLPDAALQAILDAGQVAPTRPHRWNERFTPQPTRWRAFVSPQAVNVRSASPPATGATGSP